MGTTSTRMFLLLLLSLSTCCSALPRRGSDDFPKPVLPQSLEEADTLNINNADQEAATSSIVNSVVQNSPSNTVVAPLFASNSILDSVKKVVNAIKFVQKMNAPFTVGSGDNGLMKKIGEYLESFRIVERIDDRCSDDKTKDDELPDNVSCTTTEVHGFYDLVGETNHTLSTFFEKWNTTISERVTEIKNDTADYKNTFPGGSTVVTKPNTFFSSFVKFLDRFGLDGKPEKIYDKEEEEKKEKEKEKEKENEKDGKTAQELKDNALEAGDFNLIRRKETHNYWTKSVNVAIKLAGLGIVGALCYTNCGIENLLGIGTPLPPLDPEDEAANQAAALADAAGDTDGDGDVDGDDGRRRDTVVDDSYHGYDHYGEYVGYDLQQPQVQPEQNSHVKDGRDPGYAYGTHPGWYHPPEVNTNNNNHLLEPEQHPDFTSRLLHSREYHPQPIHEEDMNDDQNQEIAPVPQPLFRGGRMLPDPK